MSRLAQLEAEVVSTEVMVLGGGIAGCFAAIRARESGLDVVMVDKANLGRSGVSHQMSGILTYFDPEKDDHDRWYKECVETGQLLADQDRLEGMISETTHRIRDLDSWGVKFQKERDEFIRKPGVGQHYARNIIMTNGGFELMSVLRGEVLRRGTRLLERVMCTDLLTSDGELPTAGRIVGAVGFNTRTGKFFIFRSKATIIATGPTRSVFPRLRIPSLSGDGKAMAFRVGCEMRNIELSSYGLSPRDFNCSPGINILFGEGAILVNAQGERFMSKWDRLRMERAPRVVIGRAIITEILEGRGPVFLDATELDESAHQRIKGAMPIVIRSFAAGGLDLRKDKIPYVSTISDISAGGIRANRSGATTVPALYAAGAASDHAEHGVANVISNGIAAAIGGYRAGETAANYALQTEYSTINELQVASLKEHIFAPMKRESGLSPKEVLDHCTSIIENGLLGPIRNDGRLKLAIEATQQIREMEIPKLIAKDYHELAISIGLGNGLLFLELLPRCALVRTESRGPHFREDYPERDDVNWLKWVIIKKGDSSTRVWTEPVPIEQYPPKPIGERIR